MRYYAWIDWLAVGLAVGVPLLGMASEGLQVRSVPVKEIGDAAPAILEQEGVVAIAGLPTTTQDTAGLIAELQAKKQIPLGLFLLEPAHSGSLELLLQAFPDIQLFASASIGAGLKAKVQTLEYAQSVRVGEKMDVVPLDVSLSASAPRMALLLRDSGTLLAGASVSQGVHLDLRDQLYESRLACLRALSQRQEIREVVGGIGPRGGAELLAQNQAYIEAFRQAALSSSKAADAVQQMLAAYPLLGGQEVLQASMDAYFQNPKTLIGHVAIVVPDILQAVRWYGDVLGFHQMSKLISVEPGNAVYWPVAQHLFGDGLTRVQIAHLRNIAGQGIELFEVTPSPSELRQPRGKAGYIHFCLILDDIESLADKIAANGGSREETSVVTPQRRTVFCTDPYGNKIELATMTWSLP